ncbi:fructose PTS transporter subunit IIA [Shouchella clausii]|uniref:PTS sugar transporter subunit IIA n=1 Tax=Shouchella clausii TaxID=79880 RepID=UPI000BA71069|nr:fructose PTS transporter subunit IIA [Shouchella clausii]PAF14402.1 PTS fructose transporter subunit IIA [Shouchella clausii]
MKLAELLHKDVIKLDLSATSKEEAIKELIELLAKNGAIESKEGFEKDVYDREAQGMTGIGGGIAIPHGKSDAVRHTAIAIGRTKQPISWETLDEKPVQAIILFAVRKEDAGDLHLKLLAKVAGALARDEVCTALLESNSKEDIIQAFPFDEQEGES